MCEIDLWSGVYPFLLHPCDGGGKDLSVTHSICDLCLWKEYKNWDLFSGTLNPLILRVALKRSAVFILVGK